MKRFKFKIEFYTEDGVYSDTITATDELEAFQKTVTGNGYYIIRPNETILIPVDKVMCIKVYEDLSV